ncbi:hypothetical protein WJX79_005336 [Trebouxia sp. C0005]
MSQGLDHSSCLALADQKKQRRLAKNRATASVSRSRKREHLQTLQVRLGELEKENARLTQKLAQQDAELEKFRQGLPSHHPGVAADIGKAEEEAVTVQERTQCPKAVVLHPAHFSPSMEALPAVKVPANQPASFSIITSGDSSQPTLKRERSINLIHLSGKQAPPDTSEYPVKRQATSSAMHPGSTHQGLDCLHSEPTALSQEHVHYHDRFHHHQPQPDMVQAGSSDFDSLHMYAPTGLADAQHYSGQAPDAQQPLQQAAWTSMHLAMYRQRYANCFSNE